MNKGVTKKAATKLMIWSLVFCIILLVGIVTLTAHHSSVTIQQWLAIMNLPLTIFRCTGYVLVFFLWPRLMNYLAKHYQWDEKYLEHVLAQRYKILTWFMLFELIFAQNVIGQIIRFYFHR